MYNLPYFKEEDQEVVLQFMREHPFVFLSGVTAENKPVATQVPVFIDEKDGKLFLTGHIMRNNDHHKAFEKNPNVLAVFTGPHTYVSATWYDDPHQASTWNYMSVHAKGAIRFGNYDDLVAILKRLTLHYENNNTASTTVFDNLTSEYTEPLLKAIIAFEVEITSIENVFKLSQNRNEKSYNNIIAKLQEQSSDGKFIAEEMKKRQQQLFDK
ncbi:MAG TPA: FMN-binding negative transcriptional regulator [Chitinophagaceae bacterium]|nr:FMN-binding negative transcriptional regulator [Chitinophagaceae bacterium]